MAVDLGGRQVGWLNPRTGNLHRLKFDTHVQPGWLPLYVVDEQPSPECARLTEVLRQAQERNRTLVHRIKRLHRQRKDVEQALQRRKAENLRTRLLVGELEDQLAGTRVRLDDWRDVANGRTKEILRLDAEVEHLKTEWHKVNDARRNYAIENGRLRPPGE